MKINKKMSRTSIAIKNSGITFVCQLVYLVLSFICRTIFTYLLGAEYLGINGLFANIIIMLSFAELGLGTALVYRMYEPLANSDYKKLSMLLRLYKKIYNFVILIIICIGTLIIPFIPYLVEAPAVSEDIKLLYLLYLAQTVVSYIFVYKKSLLIADQKNYIVNIYTQVFNIIQNIVQIIVLLFWKNYIIYLLIAIIFNLLNNITCSAYADKKYCQLKKYKDVEIDKKEIKSLFRDAKGLLYTKVATTAYSGTDSLFISAYIGIKYVGILSNYTLFLSIINGIMNKVLESITASLGNKIANKEQDELPIIINRIFFANTTLYGFVCLIMIFLLREFVTGIWLTKEYYLPFVVVLLTIIELFIRSVHFPIYITRNALGSFSEYKGVMLLLALVNILLDFWWVKPLGIAGLYLSTIICRCITYIFDIYVVYNVKLHFSCRNYFLNWIKWIVFLCICSFFMWVFKHYVVINGIVGLILYFVIFFFIYFLLYFMYFKNDDSFKYYIKLIRK